MDRNGIPWLLLTMFGTVVAFTAGTMVILLAWTIFFRAVTGL